MCVLRHQTPSCNGFECPLSTAILQQNLKTLYYASVVFRECADIMTGGSRRCIVVSTLAEASFYADNGYDDILYAYPLPFDKVERCAELSERLSLFHVLLDNRLALQELKKRPLKQGKVWRVWMKLDCDNGRGKLMKISKFINVVESKWTCWKFLFVFKELLSV